MTGHELINPPSMAPAKGFAHAVKPTAGRTVYIAGQVAADATGAIVGETLAEQYGVALGNVVTALDAAGGSPSDIVSLVIYTTAIGEYRSDLRGIGAAHREHLDMHFPATAMLGVTELVDPAAIVEIIATAVVAE